MKYLKHLFTAMLLLCCSIANAHDFVVDGIYYSITDATNNTVEVTYRGDSYNSYSNEYTGSVVIPKSITFFGTTYSVTSIGWRAFYGCTGLTSVINYSLLTFNKGLEDNGYVAYYAEKVINTNNYVSSMKYN